MVVSVFLSLAGIVKARLSKAQVDSAIFALHYRWTTTFCFLGCALVATSDFIGNPIECLNAEKAQTTYCWVASTFTLNSTTGGFTHYGAHNSRYDGTGAKQSNHETTYHAYYQWVPFILFLQGCLFYLPHLIWKHIEGKHLENILQGLNIFSLDEDSQKKKKEILVKHLKLSTGMNQRFVVGYFICEVLNFINVVGQMFLLDTFFDGMFLDLGSKVLFLPTESDASRNDALIHRFPRVVKCTFQKYGPSGSVETHDFLCILPQNLLNEKIFLIMWIWFIVLACCTGVQIIYRLAIFNSSLLRIKMLEKRGKIPSSFDFHQLIRTMRLGDFFLLNAIARNVDTFCLRDILQMMSGNTVSYQATAPKSPHSASENRGYSPHFEGVDTIDMRLRKKASLHDDDEDSM